MANNHPPSVSDRIRAVIVASHAADQAIVIAGLDDPDASVRQAALSGCVRLGVADIPLFKRFLADDNAAVRRRAVELAPRLDDATALVDRLVELLDDDPTVAEVGSFALGEIGVASDEVVASLEATVREHDDALCRESAVAALGALHAGRATILAALTDKATVRRRAVIALAPFDGEDIDAALETALNDRDWQVRQAAEDLLG